jgi:hypothetical protein
MIVVLNQSTYLWMRRRNNKSVRRRVADQAVKGTASALEEQHGLGE